MDSFDISSDSEEGLLDEIVVTGNNHSCYKHPFNLHHHNHRHQQQQHHHHPQQHQHHQHEHQHSQYDPLTFPPHFCEHNLNSDDNSSSINETSSASTTTATGACINEEPAQCNPSADGSSSSEASTATTSRGGSGGGTVGGGGGGIGAGDNCYDDAVELSTSGQVTLGTATTSFNHQLTADMCSYKNSKSRRLEYSLKCLKYGRSNPSQDSAFGSLTDGDLSIGSSSFRLSSFQSITSPIDEGVEDIIIATTTAGSETCLELATVSTNGQSNDSAISTPCREGSPNFLAIDENSFTTTSGSNNHNRPQQFPVTLSPKIQITTSASTSNLQFDPPKILVNDQNSIYTTSPSKRSGTIEVFSQKYRVCSFEDMSPNRKQSKHHLKNANRLAFRSLEEEQRIDSAFIPIQNRTNSENRVNINNSEKYKKLTHSSFSRISKTTSSVTVAVEPPPNQTNAGSQQRDSRHTLWRDSKFYRKNRIAKSNDSLLESPNHSPSPCRLSPSSLRDNHYEASSPLSSSSSSSFTRHGLNRGSSVNEISNNCSGGSSSHRRYCSSKSEDLGDLGMPTTIDSRKSHSERHLFGLSKLRQTAITNTVGNGGNGIGGECFSEDETFNHQDDNKSLKSLSTCSINRVTLTTTTTTTRTKKKTTSMAVLPSGPTITCNVRNSVFKSLDHALNYIDSNGDDDDVSSSTEESPRRHYSDIARIFGSTTTRASDDPHSSSCSEEKTPLLDSVEMSPISPTEPDLNM
ncbi:uncharacterized protein LOC129906299 [Episyrphus balteatus]|uniref:uncharacterized protein LOC129906299 n=1 Tax=Episyrphus balteatus TaxID=286459 RepID=UPI00248663E2|nr:uncharacterized protein LOC129906299 [Episyrphus balteatus]XP_055837974.1 uncharacterized protein LOC129906299 [Episyrphus balteatus]